MRSCPLDMTPESRRWQHGCEAIVVTLLLAMGAALRLYRLDLGWFGVDQARDIAIAFDIRAGHDLPTVGPTMHLVTSLGAFYYYFWSVPNLIACDPLAAYWFAALLGLIALVVTWRLARRMWGARPAVVALAIGAAFPIAVINDRVAWAPAALPAAAVLILWLLLGPATDVNGSSSVRSSTGLSTARTAALGMVLGLAVQLHLAMIAWVVAAIALLLIDRLPRRRLAAGALGLIATGFPAAAVAITNAGHDAGLTSLATRGPIPNVVARLGALYALTWRVPAAFSQGSDAGLVRDVFAPPAAVVVSTVITAGLLRLVWRGFSDRSARVIVLIVLAQVAMVIGLPGNAGYHYLDALLPLWALAAGALVAPAARSAVAPRRAGAHRWSRARMLIATVSVAASLVLALDMVMWLTHVARSGYISIDLAPLSLDASGKRDAGLAGRVLSVGVLRAAAATLTASHAPVETVWLTTHGPAFDDATGDNAFWLRWQAQQGATPTSRGAASPDADGIATAERRGDGIQHGTRDADLEHAALWYQDDPAAPRPRPDSDDVIVGPLVIVRYTPTITYASCTANGAPITVPIRLLPHPRRYADGTRQRPSTLPRRIDCAVAPGTGATTVVAAVTAGSVTLTEAGGRRGRTDRESMVCVRRGGEPSPFTIEIDLPPGMTSDLDLYERLDGGACAG
jgi:hypothetical protein